MKRPLDDSSTDADCVSARKKALESLEGQPIELEITEDEIAKKRSGELLEVLTKTKKVKKSK